MKNIKSRLLSIPGIFLLIFICAAAAVAQSHITQRPVNENLFDSKTKKTDVFGTSKKLTSSPIEREFQKTVVSKHTVKIASSDGATNQLFGGNQIPVKAKADNEKETEYFDFINAGRSIKIIPQIIGDETSSPQSIELTIELVETEIDRTRTDEIPDLNK